MGTVTSRRQWGQRYMPAITELGKARTLQLPIRGLALTSENPWRRHYVSHRHETNVKTGVSRPEGELPVSLALLEAVDRELYK